MKPTRFSINLAVVAVFFALGAIAVSVSIAYGAYGQHTQAQKAIISGAYSGPQAPLLTNTPTATHTPTNTPTITPTPQPCGDFSNFVITQSSGASIDPGTTLKAG